MIEGVTVMGVMIVSLFFPSLTAGCQILLTLPLMLTSLMKPEKRIKYGRISQLFSIACLMAMILYKLHYLYEFENKPVNAPFGHKFEALANATAEEKTRVRREFVRSRREC